MDDTAVYGDEGSRGSGHIGLGSRENGNGNEGQGQTEDFTEGHIEGQPIEVEASQPPSPADQSGSANDRDNVLEQDHGNGPETGPDLQGQLEGQDVGQALTRPEGNETFMNEQKAGGGNDPTEMLHAEQLSPDEANVGKLPSGAIGIAAGDLADRPPKELIKIEKKGPVIPLKYSAQEAAPIIQRTWRRYIDMQVYRYYRDLVNFQSQGDPVTMLRCINPKEASLLDAASGVHLKFRLAGDRFPPNIYYKIFTHRPIQDLCANAPRDYTSVKEKKGPMGLVHNHGAPKAASSGKDRMARTVASDCGSNNKEGWYHRVENNGWRLVSDRLIHHAMNDPVTWSSANKPVRFEHTKLLRIQDAERRKKQRKIDWMKEMYQQGMLKAKSNDEETIQLIEGAAEGMIATAEREGIAGVQDWEVNELLDWTSNLNYDQYINSWTTTGASSTSDFDVVERQYLRMLSKTLRRPSTDSRPTSGPVAPPARNTPATPYYPRWRSGSKELADQFQQDAT